MFLSCKTNKNLKNAASHVTKKPERPLKKKVTALQILETLNTHPPIENFHVLTIIHVFNLLMVSIQVPVYIVTIETIRYLNECINIMPTTRTSIRIKDLWYRFRHRIFQLVRFHQNPNGLCFFI